MHFNNGWRYYPHLPYLKPTLLLEYYIDKPDKPISPSINFICAPTDKISQIISKIIFKKYLIIISKLNIVIHTYLWCDKQNPTISRKTKSREKAEKGKQSQKYEKWDFAESCL